ncbi:MAG: hypothetical protein ISS83_02525 [Candidatus Pacebacteria bacterium]|nr:hypothetical protein [Candidatus Paceibacterota bacterium]
MAFDTAISVCDHGWHKQKEDFVIHEKDGGFYGVGDAFSEPHSRVRPIRLYGGKTGGEMIATTAMEVFKEANPNVSIESYVSILNRLVGDNILDQGIPLANAGLIPGTCLALAKVEGKFLHFLQFGDCLIFWRFLSGKIGYTQNPVYEYQKKTMEIRQKILSQNGNNEKEMWVEFAPILSDLRRLYTNNDDSEDNYYILNGQNTLEQHWNRSSLLVQDLKLVILCSDGYFHWEESSPEKLPGLAAKMLSDYQDQRTTLLKILNKKRMGEEYPNEASALVLKFA